MRWRADGRNAGVRVGVLVPHADLGPESELSAVAPAGVGIHAARVPIHAIAFGFTSSAYVTGRDGERAMISRLAGARAAFPS